MALNKPRTARRLPADVKAALGEACARLGTQAKVGLELKVSAPVVSQLLKDTYMGDVDTLADRIRGLYMAETVRCPVMGDIGRNNCLDYQKRPLAFTNSQRAALHQACKTCTNRKEH